jgi:phosphoribosyl-ATP pyrophosphohydrolase
VLRLGRVLLVSPDARETAPQGGDIGAVLAELFTVLERRRDDMPEGSYTAELLGGPQDKLLAKVAEEAAEVIIAARDVANGAGELAELRYELADLVYHALVVMVREGLTLDELAAELEARRR